MEDIYTSDSGKADKQIFPAKLLPCTIACEQTSGDDTNERQW